MRNEDHTPFLLAALVFSLTAGLIGGYWFERFMENLARPLALGLM